MHANLALKSYNNNIIKQLILDIIIIHNTHFFLTATVFTNNLLFRHVTCI